MQRQLITISTIWPPPRHQVIELLNVDIPSVDAVVSNLSGGQRQAVAIGRAVHEGKSILILDEPTAALGVQESHQILSLIEKLRNQGQAIVIVSRPATQSPVVMAA